MRNIFALVKLMEAMAQETLMVEETVFTKLAPLQQRILLELSAGPLTLHELSEKAEATVYTVGKQLSLLQMRAKYNPLHGKGIRTPLVRKSKEPGLRTTYCLL